MISLCFYHQKARKLQQNGFRDKSAYVLPLIIDEGTSLSTTAGRATYAALLRGDIVTLVSFVKILIQFLL